MQRINSSSRKTAKNHIPPRSPKNSQNIKKQCPTQTPPDKNNNKTKQNCPWPMTGAPSRAHGACGNSCWTPRTTLEQQPDCPQQHQERHATIWSLDKTAAAQQQFPRRGRDLPICLRQLPAKPGCILGRGTGGGSRPIGKSREAPRVDGGAFLFIGGAAARPLHWLKKHFNQQELLTLLTSNFYYILYYNSKIWHLLALSPQLKQLLLSASANALTQKVTNRMQSFIDIHTECDRALPEQMIL